MPIPGPACGFLTLTQGFYASYALCPLCDWEDDGMQLANPACAGGANRESLIEAQATALTTFPTSAAVQDYARSESWRPLSPSEIATAMGECAEQYWKNKAVVHPDDAYWSRLDAA